MEIDRNVSRRPQVCFLFIGHHHQMLHAITIAAAMAQSGAVEVHVAASTDRHLDFVASCFANLGVAGSTLHRLWPRGLQPHDGARVPPKALVLAASLPLLSRFDAIIAPERTSLLLKRLGLSRPLFIHTDHGAGDRAAGYDRRIAGFDYTLLAGEKQKDRMAAEGLIRDGDHAVVGYPKFDLTDMLARSSPKLFADDRPVVLYNPHFRERLSSWSAMGEAVIDQIVASGAYNLIFAPHIRLFEGRPGKARALLERYRGLPNVHIDLGSARSCDMTYTNAADIYLGDVSSQVYEFIRWPRPCLFLNPNHVAWRGDGNYLHWNFGPVLDSGEDLRRHLDAARADHGRYRPAQVAGFARTFDLAGRSSDRAATAILGFLTSKAAERRAASSARPAPALPHGSPSPSRP